MPVYLWTSDGQRFELAANTSVDETLVKLRAIMSGRGDATDFDLASGHTMWLNGREVRWAAAFDTDDPGRDSPAVVDFSTMLLGADSGGSPTPGGPRR